MAIGAPVKLSDIIIPKMWTQSRLLEDPSLVAFFKSGIVSNDAQMDAYAKSDNNVITVKWFNELDSSDPENLSSDNPAQIAVPSGMSTGFLNAPKLFRNKSWAAMNLTAALSDFDPLSAIRSMVAKYWVRRMQAMIYNVCAGVTASNVANNGGDMVYDATANSGAAALISGDAILLAKQTMGDAADSLGVIVMHSMLFTNLQRQQLIVYLRDATAQIDFPTYLGYRIVMDDSVPVVSDGASGFIYTSYMYAPGFIKWGNGDPAIPFEVDSVPAAGNGEGEEVLYSRNHFVVSPGGFSYQLDGASAPGFNPSNATLATAATWLRKWNRKQTPFVAIKTKG